MNASILFAKLVCLFLLSLPSMTTFHSLFVGFPVMMGVLKEERDDVEMVASSFPFSLSSLYYFPRSHGGESVLLKVFSNLLSWDARLFSLEIKIMKH